MLSVTDSQLGAWLAAFIWPLARLLGMLMVAPVFAHASLPRRVKIGLGVFVTLLVAPTLPALPAVEPASWAGLFILGREILIGVAIGFTMRLVFAGIEMAGELMGLQMGLGFASFFDPGASGQTVVLSRYLGMLASLIFLAVGAHLVMLSTLTESFRLLPISTEPLAGGGFMGLAQAGGLVFAIALQLALPIIAVLLVVNLALGILARSAPQLNLFAIGFPITLGVGIVTFDLTLERLAPLARSAFDSAFAEIARLLAAFAGLR